MTVNSVYKRPLTLLILGTLLSACTNDQPLLLLSPEDGEHLLGGNTTIIDQTPSAFSYQAPVLTNDEILLFFTGNSLFNQNWVTAPASTTARDGLGPMFNSRSCSGCHFKDGRGRAPEFAGEKSTGLLLRLSIGNGPHGAPIPDPNYGDQLQDQSILTVDTEADFEIIYEEIRGTYPDGMPYSLRKPNYRIVETAHGPVRATHISPRVANQMIGLGLLDAIDENTMLSFADENDADGDGISGRPNYVWNVAEQDLTIGKFGWKANQPNVLQQVAGAFAGDIGITSSIFPDENCPPNVNCDSLKNGGSPEITDANLNKVAVYSSTLAVPARRNWEDQEVLMGRQLFRSLNCGGCHIPEMVTGQHPQIEGLSFQTIRPFTDLLLHDMGEGLADNSQDFLATGREWRTPPLWGIGLFYIVNGHTTYLHDGRARNLEEAILWHGGEAENSKQAFMNLSAEERALVIKFLNTL
ncbi:MAG: di-heme oxidoredictase family protein [Bacteroidota bacterium]